MLPLPITLPGTLSVTIVSASEMEVYTHPSFRGAIQISLLYCNYFDSLKNFVVFYPFSLKLCAEGILAII